MKKQFYRKDFGHSMDCGTIGILYERKYLIICDYEKNNRAKKLYRQKIYNFRMIYFFMDEKTISADHETYISK